MFVVAISLFPVGLILLTAGVCIGVDLFKLDSKRADPTTSPETDKMGLAFFLLRIIVPALWYRFGYDPHGTHSPTWVGTCG
jgi:hypothetical protein